MKNPGKDPFVAFLLREMIETHAAHEWLAYAAYRRVKGSPMARHLAAEELGHFRMLEAIYPAQWGRLRAGVRRRLRGRAVPSLGSELELYVAAWIFDLAGFVQLEGLASCAWAPYRKVAKRILREEKGHQEEGFARLREYLSAKPGHRARALALVKKWLAYSRPAFGQAGSPLDQLAVRSKLKSRSAAWQRGRFEKTVRQGARRLGPVGK